MWLPNKAFEYFNISHEAVTVQREEISALRAERDALKLALNSSQSNFNWITMRVNMLEVERAQLIEKAYGIRIPVPEIVRAKTVQPDLAAFSFEDIGDDMAKAIGLPSFS